MPQLPLRGKSVSGINVCIYAVTLMMCKKLGVQQITRYADILHAADSNAQKMCRLRYCDRLGHWLK
jgi:hypothetical protein